MVQKFAAHFLVDVIILMSKACMELNAIGRPILALASLLAGPQINFIIRVAMSIFLLYKLGDWCLLVAELRNVINRPGVARAVL